MEKDDFIIMIMCYYHKNTLYKILSDDAKGNDYEKFKELKQLCKEFKNCGIDNEDMDIEDAVNVFLLQKLSPINSLDIDYYNSFIDDVDKIEDMLILSKDRFLNSYSYLNAVEYENTKNAILHYVETRKNLYKKLNSNIRRNK